MFSFRYSLGIILILACCIPLMSQYEKFFSVQSIRFYSNEPSHTAAIFREIVKKDGQVIRDFLPFIRASVFTRSQQSSKKLFAKAYFYNSAKQIVGAVDPYPIMRRDEASKFAFPAVFLKEKSEDIYFVVPQNVLDLKQWFVVIIFGDLYEIDARTYPRGEVNDFSFPEKSRFFNPIPVCREIFVDPVIEYKVKTKSKKQPHITFFIRFPVGITNVADSRGVLAMCLLAHNVEEMKRKLQNLKADDEVGGLLRFAQDNKLTIICWGAKQLWNPRYNWDEQSKKINRLQERDFNEVSDAWAKGIDDISRKYGLPKNNFLLWGISAAGQYAARLALKKPEYFLAVHVHIPSSFDNPTRNAKKILWCLTTGENEIGYQRSLNFLRHCQQLGYPIIYKAIPGLGHSEHQSANQLGLVFFKYALLEQKNRNKNSTRVLPNANDLPHFALQQNTSCPESFRNPIYWGDVINQQKLSLIETKFVDEMNIIALPTKEIADAWSNE